MDTKTCQICGAEFTPRVNTQKYCSGRCARTAYERKRVRSRAAEEAARAFRVSAPVSNAAIMMAKCKPENTSEVRWRMELRRRANPELYAMAVEA